jgi:hypothetical protein
LGALLRGGEGCVRPARLAGFSPGKDYDDIGEATQDKSSPSAGSACAPPMQIHIVRTIHRGDALGPRYTVLAAGGYYQVNKYLLASLEAGLTPEQLDLEPIREGEEISSPSSAGHSSEFPE